MGLRPERHRGVQGNFEGGRLSAYVVAWDRKGEYDTKWTKFQTQLEEGETALTEDKLEAFHKGLQKDGLVRQVIFLGEGGEASYRQLAAFLADRDANRLVRLRSEYWGQTRDDLPKLPPFKLGTKDIDGDGLKDIYVTAPNAVVAVDKGVGKTKGNPTSRYTGFLEAGDGWFGDFLPETPEAAARHSIGEKAARAGFRVEGELEGFADQTIGKGKGNMDATRARREGQVDSALEDLGAETVEGFQENAVRKVRQVGEQAVSGYRAAVEQAEQARNGALPQNK